MEDKLNIAWDDDWFNGTPTEDDFLEPEAEVVEPEKIAPEAPEEPTEEISEEAPTEETPAQLVETDAYKEMIAALKVQGIISSESESLDDVIEQVEETVLSSVEQGVDAVVSSIKESIGEEGANLFQYIRNGGTFKDFIKLHSSTPLDVFDMTSESGQEQFMRYYLTTVEKQPADEVEDRLEYLISSGKLEGTASRHHSGLQKREKETREELIAKQNEQARLAKELEQKRKADLRRKMLEVNEVADFKFKPTERREIYDFLTNPTEQVEGRYVTKFSAQIHKYLQEDPGKLALIAKLMRNDFNFDEIKSKEQTKVTRTIKKNIQAESDPNLKQATIPDGTPIWEKYF